MSDKPYFVMLTTQSGDYVPMETGDGYDFELAKFETKALADQSAKNSFLGEHFGFEVFMIGGGE